MKELSKTDALAVATSLESSVNGTSLMLMFEIGDAYLLFPGDAQWGTWDAAIRESRDLLERTTFYKVGHHGSHNATPTDFVENVLGKSPSLAAAMICTRAGTKDWDIPRTPLINRLKKITPNVVRSDKKGETPDAFTRGGDNAYVDYEVAI
jgi:beta-lactamase superfamily II metal-dependent hydrolase